MAIEGTISDLADYLVNGYWAWRGQTARHWDTSLGPVSVDISALSAADQLIATQSFQLWSDVADIDFSFGTGGAIIITAPSTGEFAGAAGTITNHDAATGLITEAEIIVGTLYTVIDRTETFIHEIGHALGLGHLGPYNGSFAGSIFTNDTVQFSVMSYGRQNAFGRPATAMPVNSPAMADILAIQTIYGADSGTRSGDTVYGFNGNAGAPYDFAANARPNFTIYDTGGVDAIDASGFSKPQTIDLNPGHWSSIGGARNNIGIYLDSVIENAAGGSNADVLIGNALDNRLEGNAGNDALRGGGGNDTLLGGGGNDSYVIVDGGDMGDIIVELAGGGTDRVEAGIDYVLPENVENLTLAGTDTINGTGNAAGNSITGNAATNLIDGAGGNDKLYGLLGDDQILGGDGNDVIDGGAGDDMLDGGAGNDKLLSGDGADRVNGGGGKDVLTGGTGADIFVFDILEASSAKDTIKDFVSGTDRIAFAVSAFTGLAIFGPGALDSGELAFGTAAASASDHLVYNSATGALYYDGDGVSGAAQIWIATLTGAPNLMASDIILI